MSLPSSKHIEYNILYRILSEEWPPGSRLPSERELAAILKVTRPTLRETLKYLEHQGWISISHGKSSLVNNIWEKGGLGILGTLARYAEFIPLKLISELLEMRLKLLPDCAGLAARKNAKELSALLDPEKLPENKAKSFSYFDWNLQEKMVLFSENQLTLLIFNDFKKLFIRGGKLYFDQEESQKASLDYYRELRECIAENPGAVKKRVKKAMKSSLDYWHSLFPNL